MNIYRIRTLLILVMICIGAGCANIVAPTGGKKDKTPPKLVSVTPADSLLNTKLKRVDLHFDEYITVTNPSAEIQISPLLAVPLTVTSLNKHVTVKIVDTLFLDSTTYRISFGNAIQDLHEGNVFKGYVYTFSTGSYFDSLQLNGDVLNAATGLPDTGIDVVLYSATRPDSAVVKEKPLYVIRADANGHFSLKGLPHRNFRIYALKDENNNLIYDGGKEWIGFIDRIVKPGDTAQPPILLRVFPEISSDTGINNAANETGKNGIGKKTSTAKKPNLKEGFTYIVDIDTTDLRKRTKEITTPIDITFNKKVSSANAAKISLTYDSSGITVEAPAKTDLDASKNILQVSTAWQENGVYTLRLLKGFVKDTSGTDAMPSRYTFRTKRDEDYGKIQINLPLKYLGKQYLLMVEREKDTIYTKPVTDTTIFLNRLQPGNYAMRIIVDKNENGKWDTGNLFAKQQPEEVIPYKQSIVLKAGWEHIIDFEQKDKQKNKGTAQQPNSIAPSK